MPSLPPKAQTSSTTRVPAAQGSASTPGQPVPDPAASRRCSMSYCCCADHAVRSVGAAVGAGARDGEHAAGHGRDPGRLLAASLPGGPVALAEGHGPQHDLQVSTCRVSPGPLRLAGKPVCVPTRTEIVQHVVNNNCQSTEKLSGAASPLPLLYSRTQHAAFTVVLRQEPSRQNTLSAMQNCHSRHGRYKP